MNQNRFDSLTRAVTASGSRRALFGALVAGAGLLGGAPGVAGKKKKRKRKDKNKNLCRPDGRACKKEDKDCKEKFCLKTPFTIEAVWTNEETDHDTVLFVPNEAGSFDPSPFIDQRCNSDDTNDGTLYPFAFVSGDAQGPGNEITTFRQLLPGSYEFWIELFVMSPAADLTVLVRNANGKVVRSWTSPANPDLSVQRGWHVFNIDGAKHSITSVDELHDDHPLNENVPVTNACP